jgi:DNA modification methylase
MSVRILIGDCRDTLRTLPDRCVQTVVTSPPYFGLRDYGTGEWDGGDPACDHGAERRARRQAGRQTDLDGGTPGSLRDPMPSDCRCGARRVDRQIGLEPTPDEFVAALVGVFREVRRVLRDDGTVWLNLGDSYNAYNGNRGPAAGINAVADQQRNAPDRGLTWAGAKPKDLLGIPWMVAFALRADGWYLRSDIIWAKPNPMPESVTDRPTKAHEYLFLLSKGPRYWYDADAIREAHTGHSTYQRVDGMEGRSVNAEVTQTGGRATAFVHPLNEAGRNKRSVWTVATQPYPGAHFATFPPKLIEPCILAGSSPKACGVCGAPWTRIVEREIDRSRPLARQNINEPNVTLNGDGTNARRRGAGTWPRVHRLRAQSGLWRVDP